MSDSLEHGMDQAQEDWSPHSAHWGAFSARWNGATLDIQPYAEDPAPSSILQNFTTAMRHKARILRPMVRKAWLDRSKTARSFDQKFVACPWDEVLDLLANELSRIRTDYGAAAVFGGSYGWSSAGRFHHAQSQVHRFLNTAFGGYVRSVNSYSAGASAVILPHILGNYEAALAPQRDLGSGRRTYRYGAGLRRHGAEEFRCRQRRHQPAHRARRDATGRAPRRRVLRRLAVARRHAGSGRRALAADQGRHRRGADAGARPHAAASKISGTAPLSRATAPASKSSNAICSAAMTTRQRTRHGRPVSPAFPLPTIIDLARRLPRGRTLITVSHSLQRAQYGEQPVWMGAVLAAMLGQIGLPGGGYNYALGALGHTGRRPHGVPIPTLPQGKNGVGDFIPVARISDMLLNPGKPFEYNGRATALPRYQAGLLGGRQPVPSSPGHQPAAARLQRPANHRRARERLDADGEIRRHRAAGDHDAGARRHRRRRHRSKAGRDAQGRSIRSAKRAMISIFLPRCRGALGVEQAFAEGRDSRQWLAHLYEPTRRALADAGCDAPDFEEFWRRGELALPSAPDDGGFLRAFRNDPDQEQAADAKRQDRDPFEHHRGLWLRRLPAPPGLAALDRAAGLRATR